MEPQAPLQTREMCCLKAGWGGAKDHPTPAPPSTEGLEEEDQPDSWVPLLCPLGAMILHGPAAVRSSAPQERFPRRAGAGDLAAPDPHSQPPGINEIAPVNVRNSQTCGELV